MRDNYTCDFNCIYFIFNARQHTLSALYAIARPSVCHTVGSKGLKIGLSNFHHTVAPSFWFLQDKFHRKILRQWAVDNSLPSGSVKHGGVWKTSHILDLNVNISKTVGDASKVTLMTNRKSHIRFRLTPRSMTFDDLELL